MAGEKGWVAFTKLSGRERVFLAMLPALGLAIGLSLALLFPWAHGQPHGCPYGAPASDCFLKPNLAGQRALWSAAGIGFGSLFALGLSAHLQHGRRHDSRDVDEEEGPLLFEVPPADNRP
jgi:hypothetical protein